MTVIWDTVGDEAARIEGQDMHSKRAHFKNKK